MEHPVIHFGAVLMAFIAIMNPLVNAPVFIGVTEDENDSVLPRLGWRAALLAFLIVAVFVLLGNQIFTLFSITLPAFRIAGGLLVGLVGYHLLQGEQSSVHRPLEAPAGRSPDAGLSLAISPLAIPILAGPGTIATAMNFSAGADGPDLLRVLGALAVVCALNGLAFASAHRLVEVLGHSAISVVSRLMGLILAVVGVQMVIDGVRGAAGA